MHQYTLREEWEDDKLSVVLHVFMAFIFGLAWGGIGLGWLGGL